ncbi:MAG: hydrogenase maturation protease [Bacteroidia bacterium]|nr:hydrogenase maturation protease [Bacteroidia bacterium]
MKKTAILGFGNPVRSDDGAGCFVVEELGRRIAPEAGITLLDMGTSAFEVLFQLRDHERLILVDAVINSGEPDGTLYRLPAEAVAAAVEDDPLVFLHALKWSQALSYARRILGSAYPEDITVYLISVSNTRLDTSLSGPVRDACLRVCGLIEASLPQLASGNGTGS